MNVEQIKADIQALVDKLDAQGVPAVIVAVDLGEDFGLKMMGNAEDLVPMAFYVADTVTGAVAERAGITKEEVAALYLNLPGHVIDDIKAMRRGPSTSTTNNSHLRAVPSLVDELTKQSKF